MQVNLETFARNALRRAADYRYHRQHGMQANNIVKTLERKFGQTNPAEIKLADAYAQEVLGDVLYAPLASCVHSASWELQRRVRFAAKVLCDNLQTLTTLGAHASANLPASRRINRTYVHTVLKPLLPRCCSERT